MERGCKARDVLIQFSPWGFRKRIVAGVRSDTPTTIANCGLSLCHPDSRAGTILINPNLSKGVLLTAGEVCSPAKKIVEKRGHIICFFDRPTAEVILQSKIDHPPIPKVAVKFKRLQSEFRKLRRQS